MNISWFACLKQLMCPTDTFVVHGPVPVHHSMKTMMMIMMVNMAVVTSVCVCVGIIMQSEPPHSTARAAHHHDGHDQKGRIDMVSWG